MFELCQLHGSIFGLWVLGICGVQDTVQQLKTVDLHLYGFFLIQIRIWIGLWIFCYRLCLQLILLGWLLRFFCVECFWAFRGLCRCWRAKHQRLLGHPAVRAWLPLQRAPSWALRAQPTSSPAIRTALIPTAEHTEPAPLQRPDLRQILALLLQHTCILGCHLPHIRDLKDPRVHPSGILLRFKFAQILYFCGTFILSSILLIKPILLLIFLLRLKRRSHDAQMLPLTWASTMFFVQTF